MFDILRHSFKTGIATTSYPREPVETPTGRGKPEVVDWAHWKDARRAVAACPTKALSCTDEARTRVVTLDLARCSFCGMCAEVDPNMRMTHDCELAQARRSQLISGASYELNSDGTHKASLLLNQGDKAAQRERADDVGALVRQKVGKLFGRSLHIREVDAGSCNGCEVEVNGLNSPVYDVERFGVHFVASPRHADMLLVTGPVTRNMELALRKTYDATPEPKLVAAAGACACSGGIFGENYATLGGVDKVLPVDVYIPGCPPSPRALLHGILVALERLEAKPLAK